MSTTRFLRRWLLRLAPVAWLCATITLIALASCAARPGLTESWLRSIAFWPIVLLTRSVAVPIGEWRPFQLMLLPQGIFFAIGVLVHAIHVNGPSLRRYALLLGFSALAFVEINARAIERGHAMRLNEGPLLPALIFALGLGVVLGATWLQPWMAKRVSPRVAVTLGLLTYPLYLLHQDFGAAIASRAMRAGLAFWPAIALALAITLAIALAIVRIGEPVVRNMLDRAIARAAIRLRRGPRPDILPSASLPNG